MIIIYFIQDSAHPGWPEGPKCNPSKISHRTFWKDVNEYTEYKMKLWIIPHIEFGNFEKHRRQKLGGYVYRLLNLFCVFDMTLEHSHENQKGQHFSVKLFESRQQRPPWQRAEHAATYLAWYENLAGREESLPDSDLENWGSIPPHFPRPITAIILEWIL